MPTSLQYDGDPVIGISFRTNRQVAAGGGNNRTVLRRAKVRLADLDGYQLALISPTVYDSKYTGAIIVEQYTEAISGNKVDAWLYRKFAEVPTEWNEWQDRIVTFPAVAQSSFYTLADFAFRSSQTGIRTQVRINRAYFLADPRNIATIAEFKVVDQDGYATGTITDDTTPSVDEYLAYVGGRQEIVIDSKIVPWLGFIQCRETTYAIAK